MASFGSWGSCGSSCKAAVSKAVTGSLLPSQHASATAALSLPYAHNRRPVSPHLSVFSSGRACQLGRHVKPTVAARLAGPSSASYNNESVGSITSQFSRSLGCRLRRIFPAAAALPILSDVASATGDQSGATGSCSGLGCAQELLDSFGQPLAALADSLPSSSVLPTLLLAVAAGAAAAWRFAVYSRREYIVAATMGKYVPKGGARVLQVNGSTRDMYYYPKGTVSVKVVGPSVRPALMEQAGASAAVPVEARKQAPTDLAFQGTGSVDAVVAFNALKDVGPEAPQYLAEVARVLKPGAPFIFFDRVIGEGPAAAAQLVVGNVFTRIDEGALQQLRVCSELVDVTGDIVLKNQDPHAVGVAFRSGAGGKAGRETDLADNFDEPSWLRKGSKGRKSASRKSASKGFARK